MSLVYFYHREENFKENEIIVSNFNIYMNNLDEKYKLFYSVVIKSNSVLVFLIWYYAIKKNPNNKIVIQNGMIKKNILLIEI